MSWLAVKNAKQRPEGFLRPASLSTAAYPVQASGLKKEPGPLSLAYSLLLYKQYLMAKGGRQRNSESLKLLTDALGPLTL